MTQDALEYQAAAEAAFADIPADQVQPLSSLGNVLLGEFERAELERRETEERWLQDLRQYKGQYDPEVLARIGKNRSKAFVRKTRVKVKTLNSRMADLLFPAGSEKNWDVAPTPKPNLSQDQLDEIKALLDQAAKDQFVQARQAQQAQLAQQAQQGAQAPQAAPLQPPKITRQAFDQAVQQWAKARAESMATTIDDQLTEARYKQTCLRVIHSGNLYGTGVLKGPLIERKVRTRFVKNGDNWTPQSESIVVPFVDFVPVWRFYPDMAATSLDQCRFVYERHLMTRSEMADLASRASFDGAAIRAYVLAHPKGEARMRLADEQLRLIGDRIHGMADPAGRYEVFERWGWLDGEQLAGAGVDVPTDQLHEAFFANVWLLPSGQVIKAVLQPINGVTWPYFMYQVDQDESTIFPEGIAAIMRDDQLMLNASTRLMLDNAAIASGPQLEVFTQSLSSMENADEIVPWKVWQRNNSNPGVPAVRPIPLPSNIQELMALGSMFDANIDETTAIPKYMTGENATAGAAGTASGMSMLLGNANIVIKDLISAWDEGITRGFIQALYFWNMQFNPDNSIKGDFDVKARGTASLVAKEVRAQSLNQFAALTANALDAPMIKRDVLNRQRAEALDLADVVKTADEMAADANSAAAQQAAQAQQIAQQLQMAEAQAKIAKLQADAELTMAKIKTMAADIEHTMADTIRLKVESAYAALQAGGVATQSPQIAPAGDEILRESGWVSVSPPSQIGNLDGPPVQQTQGVDHFMPKGATWQQEPRTGPGGQVDQVHSPGTQVAENGATPPPATGMRGVNAGIETPQTGEPDQPR